MKVVRKSALLTRLISYNMMAQDHSLPELELLQAISLELTHETRLHPLINRILSLTMKHLGACRGSIILLKKDGVLLESVMVKGEQSSKTYQPLKASMDRGLAEWVAKHMQALLVADISREERWQTERPAGTVNPESALCLPLLSDSKSMGVLTLIHPHTDHFTADHLLLAQIIANLVSTGIRNAQLTAQARNSETLIQQVMDDSQDAILITSSAGEIIQANSNAVELYKLSPGEQPGKKINDLFQTKPSFNDHLAILPLNDSMPVEIGLHTAGGNKIPTQAWVYRITQVNDDRLCWTIKEKPSSQTLPVERDAWIAMVYHDLQSPLININWSLEYLSHQDCVAGDTAASDLVGIATRSTSRLERLVNSLLDITRMTDGQAIIQPQPVNLQALITETSEIVQPALSVKSQQFALDIKEIPETLEMDREIIQRVLINLIENASKYSPESSRVTLGGEKQEGIVHFWVADQGSGIPVEDQVKIFNRYTRGGSTGKIRGVGIGLAFCQLAVSAHGGKIWVESIPGSGSTFHFTLPSLKSSLRT